MIPGYSLPAVCRSDAIHRPGSSLGCVGGAGQRGGGANRFVPSSS